MLFRPRGTKPCEGQIICMCRNGSKHIVILIYSLSCYRERGTAPVLESRTWSKRSEHDFSGKVLVLMAFDIERK